MRKILLLSMTALALGACGDSQFINACEDAQARKLKDPNSYERISVSDYSEGEKYDAYFRYTATNSYGGRVSGSFSCTYKGSTPPSFYTVKINGKSIKQESADFSRSLDRELCQAGNKESCN